MTKAEKLNYFRIAAGVVGYGFNESQLDELVSIYDLVIEKQGSANIEDIAKVKSDCEERTQKRKIEEMLLKQTAEALEGKK